MSTFKNPLRREVLALYKELLYVGRDWPEGYEAWRAKVRKGFLARKHETDPEKIKKGIALGRFIMKEVEALYMLRKYRTLKQRYYSEEDRQAVSAGERTPKRSKDGDDDKT